VTHIQNTLAKNRSKERGYVFTGVCFLYLSVRTLRTSFWIGGKQKGQKKNGMKRKKYRKEKAAKDEESKKKQR